MTLPTFKSVRFRRKEFRNGKAAQQTRRASDGGIFEDGKNNSEGGTSTAAASAEYKPGVNVRKATRVRRIAISISSFCFFVSVLFLILAIIGNINNLPGIRSTYFFKLDLSSVYPQAFASTDLVFVNSIARSLGLHDFYQVGLWSYCEGYLDEGITSCSTPQNMYWFNPVSILLNELLAGASIALPTSIISALSLVRLASTLMFLFLLIGTALAFLCIPLVHVAIHSRWYSFPLSVLTFVTALLVVAASVIATVMFTIFRNVCTSQPGLNIGAELGVQMMVFLWVGAGAALVGFVIQLGLSCCCASERDVRTGRRMGSSDAYGEASAGPVGEEEKPGEGRRRRCTGRKKRAKGDGL